jgi:hypothetical protein
MRLAGHRTAERKPGEEPRAHKAPGGGCRKDAPPSSALAGARRTLVKGLRRAPLERALLLPPGLCAASVPSMTLERRVKDHWNP